MEPKYERVCNAIRLACSNRFKPVHGSDIQDWIISLRNGPDDYWADPRDVVQDMVRRGMIRRGSKMLRAHQELAVRTQAYQISDDPLWYWYTAVDLDTTPSLDGLTRAEMRERILSSPDEP